MILRNFINDEHDGSFFATSPFQISFGERETRNGPCFVHLGSPVTSDSSRETRIRLLADEKIAFVSVLAPDYV